MVFMVCAASRVKGNVRRGERSWMAQVGHLMQLGQALKDDDRVEQGGGGAMSIKGGRGYDEH